MTVLIAPPELLTPEHSPYEPRGACRALIYDRSPEVLISGPAGAGKSRACLEKLHWQAEKYPGMRGLMLRKTRESLTESALVTFEENVVQPDHPILRGPQRRMRQAYHYPNGSEIIVGGLDKPGKIMSTEYDTAFVQEAIELTEDAWESLTTRLRHGVIPYSQLIADTNPDRPTHWLKRRCDAGRTKLIESRHEDNPTLWDARNKTWTPLGAKYIEKLDALTGPRKQRLRYGRWVQAEGVVYEGWDRAIHVVSLQELRDRAIFLESEPVKLSPHISGVTAGVDWGFTNPGVILVGAPDHDGRLYIVSETYRSRQTIDWWIEQAKILQRQWGIKRFICDPSEPAYIEQFTRAGLKATGAINEKRIGIDAVQRRLSKADDGLRRLYVYENCLSQRDEELANEKKPTSMLEEIDGYIWDTASNKKHGEDPVDMDNHGMDALRYLTAYFDLEPKRKLEWY